MLLCQFYSRSQHVPCPSAAAGLGWLEEREGGWEQAGLCEHTDGGSGRKAREPALRREAEGERMEGKVRAAGGGCLGGRCLGGGCLGGRWWKPRPNPCVASI